MNATTNLVTETNLRRTVRLCWYVGMVGMVLTAPLWAPIALVDKLRGK